MLTFRYWFKCWGGKPLIIVTAAGVWYSVLVRLGLKHLIISGGVRSCVERFNLMFLNLRFIACSIPFVLHCTCRLRAVHGSAHLSGLLTLFMFHSTFLRPIIASVVFPSVPFSLVGDMKTKHYRNIIYKKFK